ncbi:MAG: ATP synthase F1 subunit gamma [Candidatus Eisenbacteria bacterium]|nr:ATP synthase F1 subunit gamma [Candidatus Eisenbacteria bacterium]
MATLRQIRRRIRSVENTRQITKAMEMVAAAKLRRAQTVAEAIRPYTSKMQEVLESLAQSPEIRVDPLFEVREVKREAWVIVASDKGLCGSYNANVFRRMEQRLAGRDLAEVRLIPVGRRALNFFRRREWAHSKDYPELGDQLDLSLATRLAREAAQLFATREVDRVQIVHTHFVSTASRRIVEEKLLPIEPPAAGEKTERDYIFEPSAEEILRLLLPRYVEGRIRTAIADSLASEHSARMLSMGNATRNAGEMIRSLTLAANKARQAAITKELTEIVGGAEALR